MPAATSAASSCGRGDRAGAATSDRGCSPRSIRPGCPFVCGLGSGRDQSAALDNSGTFSFLRIRTCRGALSPLLQRDLPPEQTNTLKFEPTTYSLFLFESHSVVVTKLFQIYHLKSTYVCMHHVTRSEMLFDQETFKSQLTMKNKNRFENWFLLLCLRAFCKYNMRSVNQAVVVFIEILSFTPPLVSRVVTADEVMAHVNRKKIQEPCLLTTDISERILCVLTILK